MKLSLSTWNSLNINDGSPYKSAIPQGELSKIEIGVVLVTRADDYPALTSSVKRGSQIIIQIIAAAGSDVNSARENVKKYFFADNDVHNLVALDLADSNKPYYRSGIPVRMVEESGAANSWFITLQTEYPFWQLVTPASDTWNITATGQTHGVTNGGNLPIRPIYTLTPTTTKTAGFIYQRYIPIYNVQDKAYTCPLEITDGGLNTGSLIQVTSISHAINQGGGITNSATSWPIDTAVGGGLPTGGGMFVVDSEQCSYTSISGGSILGVTRGIGGTTATTHGDNTVMYFSKMLYDCSDLRVWLDGREVDRWIGAPNTSLTKVWVNLGMAPGLSSTLLAGVNNSATTITFPQTKAGFTFLSGLKAASNTALLIESEIILFSPANVDLINYQITSVTRGQKSTTAASHSAAVAVYYIEHDLFILYGDSSLTAPETDDNNKPMFDLTSTNESWDYSEYYDSTADRPGSWKGATISRTKMSYTYTGPENTFPDPATAMGMAERASRDFTVPHETATISWALTHPAGITGDFVYSANKYRTQSWPGIVGLQVLRTGKFWETAYAEIATEVALAWEGAGPRSVTFTETYPSVRFVIDGTISSTIDEAALCDFTVDTINFDSTKLPVISVGSEASINFFNFKLTNTTTSEWIKIKAPCPINKALTIDTTNKSAYLYDGRVVPVITSTDRNDWLNLSNAGSGSNTLQFDDTGTVAVTLVTSHRDKIL